jgi:hypothetical protein
MMSDAFKKFLELEYKKAEMKKYFDELEAATEALIKEHGINSYLQDPVTGSVYKLITPEGTYIQFRKYGYVRTKRGDEKRGDLSIKEAQEQGFEV